MRLITFFLLALAGCSTTGTDSKPGAGTMLWDAGFCVANMVVNGYCNPVEAYL